MSGSTEIGVIGTNSTTASGTLLYELATPLLANELVNADGQLIQENPTPLFKNKRYLSLVNIDFTINVKETVKTLVENSGQSPFEALPTGTLAVPPSGLNNW